MGAGGGLASTEVNPNMEEGVTDKVVVPDEEVGVLAFCVAIAQILQMECSGVLGALLSGMIFVAPEIYLQPPRLATGHVPGAATRMHRNTFRVTPTHPLLTQLLGCTDVLTWPNFALYIRGFHAARETTQPGLQCH